MATNMCTTPMFIIENCSTLDDNKELIKTTISFPRSLSLINYGEAYKDLSGNIHYSSSNCLKNFFLRSYSCPTNFFSNDNSFFLQSPSTTMNLLDPSKGIYSPGGSSSRYSLYGSFFDLSESGYHPSLIKTNNKLLTINGRPLLIVDNTSKLSMNTIQDKCNDWLNHLDTT
jgi:hypothetical protein